jgi:hypothetical protein
VKAVGKVALAEQLDRAWIDLLDQMAERFIPGEIQQCGTLQQCRHPDYLGLEAWVSKVVLIINIRELSNSGVQEVRFSKEAEGTTINKVANNKVPTISSKQGLNQIIVKHGYSITSRKEWIQPLPRLLQLLLLPVVDKSSRHNRNLNRNLKPTRASKTIRKSGKSKSFGPFLEVDDKEAHC